MTKKHPVLDKHFMFEVLRELATTEKGKTYSTNIAKPLGKWQNYVYKKLVEMREFDLIKSHKEKRCNKTIFELNWEGVNYRFYNHLSAHLKSSAVLERTPFGPFREMPPLLIYQRRIINSQFLRDVILYAITIRPQEFPNYKKLTIRKIFDSIISAFAVAEYLLKDIEKKYQHDKYESKLIDALRIYCKFAFAGNAILFYYDVLPRAAAT